MTNDELRALADALSSGTHYVESPELHEAMIRAVDYLRAQADAQAVAWVDVTDSYEGPYIFRGKELLPAGRHDLYTHPAPAAPQAEPKRPAFLDEIDRAKEHVASWPQWMRDAMVSAAATLPVTEPKREPLSDEQIELPDYLRLQIASTAAAHDVLVERRRQVEVEGWTPEHDDEHVLGEMAALAAFYAVPDGVRDWDFSSTGYGDTLAEALLPNGWTAKAGEDRRRDLVKAGALILAEIERLDRMGVNDGSA